MCVLLWFENARVLNPLGIWLNPIWSLVHFIESFVDSAKSHHEVGPFSNVDLEMRQLALE